MERSEPSAPSNSRAALLALAAATSLAAPGCSGGSKGGVKVGAPYEEVLGQVNLEVDATFFVPEGAPSDGEDLEFQASVGYIGGDKDDPDHGFDGLSINGDAEGLLTNGEEWHFEASSETDQRWDTLTIDLFTDGEDFTSVWITFPDDFINLPFNAAGSTTLHRYLQATVSCEVSADADIDGFGALDMDCFIENEEWTSGVFRRTGND